MIFQFLIVLAFGVLLEAHSNYDQSTIIFGKRPFDDEICTCFENETSVVDDVQKIYSGCLQRLELFPYETHAMGQTVLATFKKFAEHLQRATKDNSTITSKGSVQSLKAIAIQSKMGNTKKHLLNEFQLAVPKLTTAFRDIVLTLSPSINDLSQSLVEDMSHLDISLMKVLTTFNHLHREHKVEHCSKINYDEIMSDVQNLINTISCIAETALDECDRCTYHNDVFDATKVAAMIVYHILISVQGTLATIASELISVARNIPPSQYLYLQIMDSLLNAIAASISSPISDSKKGTRAVLATFVKQTKSLNEELEQILGPFRGCIDSVARIEKNLKKVRGH